MPLFHEEKKILEKYADIKIAKSHLEDDILSEVEDVDLIMVCYAKITRKIIEAAKNLKGIVRYGIGVDNIDLEAATEKGIYVSNVPEYCIGTVADHAFALILTLARKIILADKVIRTGEYLTSWTSPSAQIKGLDLDGKTLGIIGLGKIGRALMRRAKGFNMKIIVFDPYLDKSLEQDLGMKLVDFTELLEKSDFVSVHAPLIPQTRHMLNAETLKLMKKTAYLINVARGPIIDEKALYLALSGGWIAGAGVDVYESEPPHFDNPLFKLDNVVLTPHTAWFTEDAIKRLEMSAVNQAISILQNKLPDNLVNQVIKKEKEI